MDRKQFLRALSDYCSDKELSFRFEKSEGKGSHGMVYVGERKTVVKKGKLTRGYCNVVLKQLGLDKDSV